MEEVEIWKDVINYNGVYKVSDLGRIKSLKYNKERIRKLYINKEGYYEVCLSNKGKLATKNVHILVAQSFLKHISCGMELVVDHIDINKLNNNKNNLRIIRQRINSNKKHIKSSSKYTGVHWYKKTNKWKSTIMINGKAIHLGYFNIEIEASQCYEDALFRHNNYPTTNV